jgi:hypothetical protein
MKLSSFTHQNAFLQKPVFIFLLPVFFVFHGYTQNYDAVPGKAALLLTLKYMGISVLFVVLFSFFFKNQWKAGWMTFLIMSFHFFFGSFLAFLKNYFPGSFIIHYRIVLPFILAILLLFFIYLKKRTKPISKATAYLNLLLVALIMIDFGSLIIKIPKTEKKKHFNAAAEGFTICDSCYKPDIFLIIPDEYCGTKVLHDIFQFDNSAFLSALKARGFYVAHESRSNYNSTPFSVASTLNMELLPVRERKQDYNSIRYSYEVIKNNRLIKFLTASGYQFYNCSIFDFEGQPAHKYSAFLPYGINLVTAQTFTDRLIHDMRQDILNGRFGLKKIQKKLAYENLRFNEQIFDLTVKIAAEKSKAPKFVYTHLMMPHFPFYYDSLGNSMPLEKLRDANRYNRQDYISYLQYSNRKILQLTDSIMHNSPTPPVIIILSDHGFRHPQKNIDPDYDFINLNAVYFPNKNYSLFYDSITNINQFRVLLNTYFHQHLPILKDSTYNLNIK